MLLVGQVFRLYLLALLCLLVDCSISWLALSLSSSNIAKKAAAVCRNLPGLNRRQIKFCRRNLESMESIRIGAREAYSECQYQFHKRRWNCTMIDPETNTVFGDVILKEGTREAAFVHAISAAGVAYRITKDCSRGVIDKCGCDLSGARSVLEPSPAGTYSYKGCSDNVHYGIAVSADFVDAAERNKNQSQERRLMNEHNNRAGREVLSTSLRRECKCHGDKFDGATEVAIVPGESRPRMERKNPMFKRHTPADLVYLDNSLTIVSQTRREGCSEQRQAVQCVFTCY
uniref:Protein Wnt n=1 Tax=Ditylenchus dipsaci TaxID=166011 RepID=A0A915EEQ8_9BILA